MSRVPFSNRRFLDPRRCNIALDANALNGDSSSREILVQRFCELADAGVLTVVVGGGVRDEIEHPKTPARVQVIISPRIFNLRPSLNVVQQAERVRIFAILRGNARPEKHAADASHLSEASETGCAYFITHDQRIINKRDELASILPPSLSIVSLVEFFQIFDDYEAGRRI